MKYAFRKFRMIFHEQEALLLIFISTSRHRRCYIKRVFLKISQNSRGKPVPEPHATLLKKGSDTGIFL